jgi:type IV pilus assembly protein PilO
MEVIRMKLSKRESNLLVIVLVGLAVYTYYNFFLSNIIDRYLSLKKDMKINQQQLLSLQKDKNDIDFLIKEIEKSKKQIAEMEMLIPSSKKVPEIITQLESLSKGAGVKLTGIVFESDPKEKKEEKQPTDKGQLKPQNNINNVNDNDYVEIPIQLNLEGSYNNIISFLATMENFKRLYNIRNITLNKKQGDTGENLEMQLGISTFAIKYNQKLMEEPTTYDFMNKNYGRQNPFKSLETGNNASTSTNASTSPTPSKTSSKSGANILNQSNMPTSPQNNQQDKMITDFMERFLKLILEDAEKSK